MKTSPFQFSLAALLLTVAVVAGVLALMLEVPRLAAVSSLVAVVVVLLALLTTAAVYGSHAWRPFCIGAAFPLALLFLWAGLNVGSLFIEWNERFLDQSSPYQRPISYDYQYLLGSTILGSILLGYVCLGFRWLIEMREPPDA